MTDTTTVTNLSRAIMFAIEEARERGASNKEIIDTLWDMVEVLRPLARRVRDRCPEAVAETIPTPPHVVGARKVAPVPGADLSPGEVKEAR